MEIRFVVRAGYNQEQPEQKELAHLLEHMPYIETENFKEALTYFDRLGVKRGSENNALTVNDRTYFYMKISPDNPEVINKAIQFYGDCAHGIVMSSAKKNV